MAVWNEIHRSELTHDIRIDTEYYKSSFIELDNKLNAFVLTPLGRISNVTDGEHGSVKIVNDGVKYLTAENVKNGFVEIDSIRYVDFLVDHRNARARVETGDTLISIKGTLGQIAYCEEWLKPANMNRDVAIIKPFNSNYNKAFISTFLLSKYGLYQLAREGSGGVQQMITLGRLREIKIPLINKTIQKIIADHFLKALELKQLSQSLYTQAQELLERELELDKLVFDKPLSYEARLSEVVGNNRADADYYQTRYKQLRSNISGNRTGIQRLIDFAIVLKPNIDPSKSPSSEFKYVELADINPTLGIINNANTFLGKELPSRARRVVTKGDVIASSVVGSVDKAALVDETNDGCLASTGFFHFRPKKNIKSEFLLLLVRSRCVTMQLQQESTGGILSAVPDQRLRNVIIPNIDLSIQNKIAALVCQSHKNFNQSKQLLEQAKRRVEELIEQAVQK